MKYVSSEPTRMPTYFPDGESLLALGLKEQAKIVSLALLLMRLLLEEHQEGYKEIDRKNRHSKSAGAPEDVSPFPSLAALSAQLY